MSIAWTRSTGRAWTMPNGARARLLAAAVVYPGVLLGSTAAASVLIQKWPALPVMAFCLVLVIVALVACERLLRFRAEWQPNRAEITGDLLHAAVNAAVPGAVRGGLVALAGLLVAWVGVSFDPVRSPLLSHLLSPLQSLQGWSLWARVPCAILVGELGVYWAHRAAHAWLWRFHAVHHAVSKLNWLNAVHFHPLDVAWMQLVSMTPLLALGLGADALAVYSVFAQTGTFLQHCNIDLRLGGLNRIFNTPDYHRWHHSPDRVEANHNYGGTLILWDLLFGTRLLPAAAPHRELGARGRAPQTYGGQLLWPFARHS